APDEVRGEPRLRRKIAWELYQTGDLDGALAAADGVLGSTAATGPDGDSMRLLKGLILSAQGHTEEAIVLLDKIRESDPDNLPLAVTVAHLFQRVGRNDQAVAILGKLAESLAHDKKTKEEREVRLELGQVLLAAKQWDRAGEAVAPLLDAKEEEGTASTAWWRPSGGTTPLQSSTRMATRTATRTAPARTAPWPARSPPGAPRSC